MTWLIRQLLDLGPDAPVTYYEWSLRSGASRWWLVALLAGAVGIGWLMYRSTPGLTRPLRLALGAARVLLLALLVLLLFDPALAVEFRAILRGTVLVLVDDSQSMATPDEHDSPRLAAARRIIAGRRWSEGLDVRYFTFSEALKPHTAASLADVQAVGRHTALGDALEEVVARHSGRTIAGVFLLTDGASNAGVDPLDAAQRLAGRGVRVYPIGLGRPDPPDVALSRLVVQDVVFAGDALPVRVQVDSVGYAGRDASLVATLSGVPVASKPIQFTGATQFEQFEIIPRHLSGDVKLSVRVSEMPGEASAANNVVERTLSVIDRKVRVLYVEGAPRWEYRYLRAVLLRDQRLTTRFLMTEGDQELARGSDEFLESFPSPAELDGYDLVILGDVPAGYFSRGQLESVAKLVGDKGGSLLMLAGRRYAPTTYAGTPLQPLLPVRLPAGMAGQRVNVPDAARPVVTTAGSFGSATALESNEQLNAALWAQVGPMYDLPLLDGVQPGAVVLLQLELPMRFNEPYPLVAWHRYGAGKAMYVGVDQLWRLRFKRGDLYHARFWGQAAQFLALSRLLGQSQRVRIETDLSRYALGQPVRVLATVSDDAYAPVRLPAYPVRVILSADPDQATTLPLQPRPDSAGLYEAVFTPTRVGRYTLSPPPRDADDAARASFDVTDESLEMLQPALRQDVLTRIAQITGGRYCRAADVPAKLDPPTDSRLEVSQRRDITLGGLPPLLVVLVALAAFEWITRRRANLV